MGFLLFADALGIQALLERDPVLASLAIADIGSVATKCLDHHSPGGGPAPGRATGAKLVIFNDCFYFYCHTLAPMIHYASQVALNLFMSPSDRGGPIALRGAIVKTRKPPSIVFKNHEPERPVQSSRLVVDNLPGALIAEKRKVLGARIVFPRDYLEEEQYLQWDYRLQAKVMSLAGLPMQFGADTLTISGLEGYCDVAWMNTERNEPFKKLSPAIQTMQFHVAFGQRATIHAGATLAMWRATDARRHGLVVILRQLWHGVKRTLDDHCETPKKDDYERWMALAATIKAQRNGELHFPVDMTGTRPPRR